jgi:hypothetical protein
MTHIGGRLYVIGGIDGERMKRDIQMFDLCLNVWELMVDVDGEEEEEKRRRKEREKEKESERRRGEDGMLLSSFSNSPSPSSSFRLDGDEVRMEGDGEEGGELIFHSLSFTPSSSSSSSPPPPPPPPPPPLSPPLPPLPPPPTHHNPHPHPHPSRSSSSSSLWFSFDTTEVATPTLFPQSRIIQYYTSSSTSPSSRKMTADYSGPFVIPALAVSVFFSFSLSFYYSFIIFYLFFIFCFLNFLHLSFQNLSSLFSLFSLFSLPFSP